MIDTKQKSRFVNRYMLRPGHWDATAAAWSKLIPHDWPGEQADALESMLREGRAELLEVLNESGEKFAFVVYSVQTGFAVHELLIQAAFSADGKTDLTRVLLPEIEAKATELGCGTIRFHTMRPGLIEKTLRQGWRVSEVIMRKDIRS